MIGHRVGKFITVTSSCLVVAAWFLVVACSADAAEQPEETPATISKEIVTYIDSAKTLADVESVIEMIIRFNDEFSEAPENTVLAKRAVEILKLRAKLQKNEAKARALESRNDICYTLADSADGFTLSKPAYELAYLLSARGLKYDVVSELPPTSFEVAMKDPDAERCKSIVVTGWVVQIEKEGNYYSGVLCADEKCVDVYHFITPGTTHDIVRGSLVTLAGVFAQRYSYPNTKGGTTHSLALVGYFRGQE